MPIRGKIAFLPDFPARASSDPDTILAWDEFYSDCNVGVVAILQPGEYWFLDDDQGGALKTRFETETNLPFPTTFTVQTGARGFHHYFRHTPASLAMGNITVGGEFEARANNYYVVGPGSIHPATGNTYSIFLDVPFSADHDALVAWLLKVGIRTKPTGKILTGLTVEEARAEIEEKFDRLGDLIAAHHEVQVYGEPITYSTADGLPAIRVDMKCLNAANHSGGGDDDTPSSCSLLITAGATNLAAYRCHHGHCGNLTWNWFLRQIGEDPDQPIKDMLEKFGANVVVPHPSLPPLKPGMYPMATEDLTEDAQQSFIVQDASTIKPEILRWLWLNRIPVGKIVLYTGKPDCGKSLALLDLITRVTTGNDFPDGANNNLGPCDVLLAATEDDANDTIIPRLIGFGADLTKVKIVQGIKLQQPTGITNKKFSLKTHIRLLLDSLKKYPSVKLIVFDPITSFLGDADFNSDKDIRPMLESLVIALAKNRASCVGISHSNKSSNQDAIHKVSGAGALAQVVRAVWGFSKDPEDKTLYHMALVKGNLGPVKTGLDYAIEGIPVVIDGEETSQATIVWGGVNELDADDLLKAERSNKDSKDTKQSAAALLIKATIPAKIRDIYAAGEAEGITAATIKHARYKIDGLLTKSFEGSWWWFLPDNPPSWWVDVSTKPPTTSKWTSKVAV
jgi:putative DNA primase/helicase